MATEAALEGLYVGADQTVTMTVYQSDGETPQNIAGWTILLDIRKRDTSSDPALLSVTGTVSGVYNVDPNTNTQVVTFTLTDDNLAASIFPGDDWTGRYSIKRTTAGSEMPLRFGDVTVTRVTQA